jgi:uncharacterized protein involved in exopolysaccharide biosynthesis
MINSAGSTEETDLLKTSLVVLKHKRMIAVTTILCMTLAVLYVLLLPNQYTGETKLLAPQTQDSMASVLSLQGALSMGGFGGAAKSLSSGMLGLKDPNAVYIGELKSHTIADRLIARFDLKTLYHKERQVDTRKALEGATKIESSKDGGITIQVTDKDRKRAADLANAYVQELQQLTDQLASYQASERSKYYESEIQKVQEQLISSEAALKGNQEKTGMLDAATQTKSVMLAAVSLKAEIAAKEVEIRGMSSFETPQNQDVKLAKEELSALQSQLAQLKYGSNAGGDDILVPAQKIPQDALEYLRNYRDVMYYERIYDLLSIQYAAAKADEGRNALVIQVLDPAEPPERKSKPHRTLIVFFVAILAFSGSVFAVFVIEGLEQLRRDPVRAQELDSIKAMLPGGFIRKWFFRPKAE